MRLEYRTDQRGYIMWLDRDLFGAFVLYQRWYGLPQSSARHAQYLAHCINPTKNSKKMWGYI